MPTAAKLFCALLMMGVGFATSRAIVFYILPEGTVIGYFFYVNMALGLALGWRVLGRMVGETIWVSAMNGMLVGGYMLALGISVQAFYEMIVRSMDLKYSGVEDALNGAFELISGYIVMAYDFNVLGLHFGASAIAGAIGHVAARRWR